MTTTQPRQQIIRVGCAATAITPPLGVPLAGYLKSEGRVDPAISVTEDLTAQAVAFESRGETVLMITVDAVGLPDSVVEAAYEGAEAAGIDRARVLIGATHSHNTPHLFPIPEEEAHLWAAPFSQRAVDELAARVRELPQAAVRDLTDAVLSAGTAECRINVNRRERLPDGSFRILPWLGQNPDGPTDPEVTVLRVDRADRSSLVLAWYGCHPVVLGVSCDISPDYVGPARRYVKSALGSDLCFFQGASGDVNPVVHPGTHADSERLGRRLGAAIVYAASEARPMSDVTLDWDAEDIRLDARTVLPEGQLGVVEEEWREHIRMRIGDRTAFDVPTRILRVGSFAVVGVAVELFSELGMQFKKAVPGLPVAVTGLCGPYMGYLPTLQAHQEGGYEAINTVFAPGTGEALADRVCVRLRDLMARPAGSARQR